MLTEKMKVRFNFTEDILGSWPADQALLTRFISKKAPDEYMQVEESDSLRIATVSLCAVKAS